jgi:hypothetical protein
VETPLCTGRAAICDWQEMLPALCVIIMDLIEVAARDDMSRASGSFQSRCARRFDARFQF